MMGVNTSWERNDVIGNNFEAFDKSIHQTEFEEVFFLKIASQSWERIQRTFPSVPWPMSQYNHSKHHRPFQIELFDLIIVCHKSRLLFVL